MHDFLRSTLREWTPPIIRRRITHKTAAQESWGRARYGLHGVRLPDGRRFTYRPLAGDRAAVSKIFFKSQYSTHPLLRDDELQRFYRECEHPLIIDGGANIGAASVWFALTYPRATVIAVEPQEENFAMLAANARAFPNILPVRAALASTTGRVFVNDTSGGAEWRSLAYHTGPTAVGIATPVDAVTLPDLLRRAPGATPFICKLDIEGAEEDVFSGPLQPMDRFPLVVAELHDWMLPGQATSRTFLQWHVAQGRDLVTLGENAFSIAARPLEPVAGTVRAVASAH